MLIGGNFSPYRTPAGGVPFYCGEYANASGDDLRVTYVNTTKVKDTSGGDDEDPYERDVDLHSSTGCDANSNCPGVHPCATWLGGGAGSVVQYTMVAGQSTTAPQSYEQSSVQFNFAVCHKRGFKSVVAKRQWHGMFGMLTEGVNDTSLLCGDGSRITLESYKATPDATKYLSWARGASRSAVLQDGSGSYIASHSIGFTVNSNSGRRTGDECTKSETGAPIGDGPTTIYGYDLTVLPRFSSSFIIEAVESDASGLAHVDVFTEYFSNFLTDKLPDDTFTQDSAGGSLFAGPTRVAANGGPPNPPSPPNTFPNVGDLVESYTISGLSGTRTMYGMSSTFGVSSVQWKQVLDESASLANDGFTYNNTVSVVQDGIEIVVTTAVSVGLSNTNTAAQIYEDIKSLLELWPLDDDALYPWRTDGFTNVAVKVSRNEIAFNVRPDGITDCTPGDTYVDDIAVQNGVVIYDGSVQGAPNPAGYQNYFNFGFQDWRACCSSGGDSGGSGLFPYVFGYAPSLDGYIAYVGAQLPRNATQWTDNFEVMNHPWTGGFIAYSCVDALPSAPSCNYDGTADSGAVWARKWAECGETYQSSNFARPAGADKFKFDETTVYCSDGVNLTLPDGTPAASLTLTGPWGGKCVDGWFDGATTDGSGVLTLGTKLFEVPSDWHSDSRDDDTAFGKLHWSTYPSLLGRIPITAVADAAGNQPFSHAGDAGQLPGGSPVDWVPTYQFSSTQTSFGMAHGTGHEQIDIFNVGMSSVAANVTATRTSDSKFTVATPYASAAFVTIHAQDFKFCDNYPKGDYIYLEWLHDFRTNQENGRLNTTVDCDGDPVDFPATNFGYATFSQTADALPIQKCSPRVVCFSPNGEIWDNGNTYDFPDEFQLDERYGCKWQAQVLWSMTDPLWHAPHAPCSLHDDLTDDDVTSNITWTEDDGACRDDHVDGINYIAYYGLAPMMEARLTVPSGFPALPGDVDALGFLSPVDHNTGDVAYPPGVPGYGDDLKPAASATPWALAVTLCEHLDGCRFNYSDWVIGCPPAP